LRGEADHHFGDLNYDRHEDRTGLSTQVETSDRGVRRNMRQGRDVERIDEEE